MNISLYLNTKIPILIFALLTVCFDNCNAQDQAIGMPDPRLSWNAIQHLEGDWESTGSTDWQKAAILGLLSKTAYEDDVELMNYVAKGMGFEECRSFQESNSAAHALIGDRVVVIAFRGTEFTSLADWRTDAYTKFFKLPGVGRMHTGFHIAYQDVREEVENVINENDGKTIWLTGHSLGGAMAVVGGVHLKKSRLADPQIITYGQPRVGDNQTARWIDRNFPRSYQRIVNNSDAVPTLPPTWYFQYADAGQYILIGQPISTRSVVGGPPAEAMNKLLTTARPAVFALPVGAPQADATTDPVETVYQSPRAHLPLTRAELEALIEKENQLRTKTQTRSLYFPDNIKTDQPLLTFPMSSGPGKLNQPMMAGGFFDWSFFNPITDHLMAGYLELIREQRDN